MVKTRMTTVDVAAEVRCLRKLIGMRCANIYDLSPTTYVFKFAKSSGVSESGESERALVLLESGVRLHSTEFSRDKSSTPSGFTLKLRKHLRTRRLEDVRQLGIDRVVDFQFGLGDTAHHIILEVYGQGNLLLTDADHTILQLLRTWKNEEKGLSMVAHQRYPFDSCRLLERTTETKLAAMFRSENVSKAEEGGKPPISDDNAKKAKPKWGKEGAGKISKGTAAKDDAEIQRKGATTTLKHLLGDGLGYGPILIEHIILDASLQPDKKIVPNEGQQLVSETDFRALMEAVKRFEDWLEAVVKGETIPEGYVFMQKPSSGKKQQQSAALAPDGEFDSVKEKMYDEFYPLVLRQLETREHIKFETFDIAMDDFFGKVEGQRAQRQRKTQEDSAMSKLDKIRADQTNRAKALEKEVDQSVRMAELIEYNLADVDAGISAVRAALAGGMDWKDLGRMIKEEKKAGNPVAGLIHSLQLETNQITLLLSNNLDDMDEEEKTQPVDKVEVDLSLSAHANARRWFETKKRHATKQEKTLAAHEKAFKAAEKKTQQNLAQAKTVAAITHIRKVHWFEKFNWFISSENYLVISGRDAQQNELLVKRYMKKGDLYVHADLHGASTTIIKNHNPQHPVSPLTINQAGCFTVCRSQAWDSKIVTSAWWVEASQVSKTAPTGEYLTVGSFMVRGKKNFLPPNPLVMGYGFLFRLDESSLGAHLNERQVRGEEDGSEIDLGSLDADLPVENSSDVRFHEDDRGIEHIIEDQKGEGEAGVTSPDSELNMDDDQMPEQDSSRVDDGDSEAGRGSELVDLLDEALQLRSVPKIVRGTGKYALDDLSATTDNDVERPSAIVNELFNASNGVVQRGKPYLSKVERRKLKKGGTQGGNLDQKIAEDNNNVTTEDVEVKDEMEEKSDDDGESNPKASTSDRGAGEGVESSSTKPGRGRKGKLKKIKGKYSEQDEEERELRMSLLASAGRPGAEAAGAAEGNDKESKSKRSAPTREERSRADLELGQKVCYKCKKTGHIARDCPEDGIAVVEEMKAQQSNVDADTRTTVTEGRDSGSDDTTVVPPVGQEPSASKEGGSVEVGGKKDGLSRRAFAKAAKEEIAAIMAEENVLELGEDEKEKLTELDSLTGKPLPSDILLYAVPMCGPYSALQGFKYRVKLTPGSAKRGKAAKVAVDVFAHMQEVSAREKQLMKAVTDPELFACMIGNAKVTAPGFTKLKQTSKKSNKASAKSKS